MAPLEELSPLRGEKRKQRDRDTEKKHAERRTETQRRHRERHTRRDAGGIEAKWRQKKRREHSQRGSESHFIAIL